LSSQILQTLLLTYEYQRKINFINYLHQDQEMSVMEESSKTWCPAIELNETEKDLILKAEIPGVEIKHLNISAEPELISISGLHNHHKLSLIHI
jgi:HSP20 family protein